MSSSIRQTKQFIEGEDEIERVHFVSKTDFSFRAHLSYTRIFRKFDNAEWGKLNIIYRSL